MRRAAVVLVVLAQAVTAGAGGSDVTKEKYTWNLADLYATREAFAAARTRVTEGLPALEDGRGRVGESASALKSALDEYFGLAKDLARLMTYASLRSDQDMRVQEALAARQEVRQIATDFRARSSWLAPEILALPEGTVAGFLRQEPGLEPYRFFLEDLERQRAHTRASGEEEILAEAGMMGAAPSTVYGVLANADMPYAEITLSDGQKVRLDQAGYTRYRAATNRDDRIAVFNTFWTTFKGFERTFGTALDAQTKRDFFFAKARHYPSSLAAALDASNVPVAVYHTLIEEANRALPTLYRAFRLRGALLGISDLRYYDIYPPLVKKVDLDFPIDKGMEMVKEALKPLGKEYVDTTAEGFDSRWIDVFPRPGKRAGAYSSGNAYDVHPYVLMNYNDDYESVSTLAHEWGHTMHSYLANHAQPFASSDYSIFVAEVASTFNEALLLDNMLKKATGDDERLFLLGSYLEGLRGTFFRQAMFAEFELAIHAATERGEALTGEKLSTMYGELLRRYHGQAEGVMTIDDLYAVEWAYIPHFYYNFYVYQYATSLAASAQLSEEVLKGDQLARDRYLELLKSGGSRYPYELLKEAGVDLATPAPYRALMRRMEWAMDEIEGIMARRQEATAAGSS